MSGGKRVVSVSKTGPGFAGFAQVSLGNRIKLLKDLLGTTLALAEQGKLDDATIARIRRNLLDA